MTDHENLATALADLQGNLPPITKDQKGQYGNYAGLDNFTAAMMPLLHARGIAFTCKPMLMWYLPDLGDGEKVLPEPRFVLHYELTHAPSGDSTFGDYPLPTGGLPQQLGSAITYARRYILGALTGAVAEADDDGKGASEKPSEAAAGAKTARTAQRATRKTQTPAAQQEEGPAAPPVTTQREQPPLPGEDPTTESPMRNNLRGSITDMQLRKVNTQFSKMGFTADQREQVHDVAARIVGRTVATFKDLSFHEAKDLIDKIEAAGTDWAVLEATLGDVP